MPDLSRLFSRQAALLRELAGVYEELARAVGEALSPAPPPDKGLGLVEAAALMGERPETFRRRSEYRKALLTRPGERRLRYSRVVLDRIKRERLAGNAVGAIEARNGFTIRR